jgi:hypothetical protein
MARGRYDNQEVVDGSNFGTFDRRFESMGLKDVDLLENVRNFEHTIVAGERLDVLAHKYFGEDSYWWVLALVNRISYPLSIAAGTKIRVPYDVKDVFKKIYL